MITRKILPLALSFSLLTTVGANPLNHLIQDSNVQTVEAATVKKVNMTGVVTTDALNVRANSTTKAKVLGKLKRNATVQVVGSISGWYKIKYQKGYGYISAKYVKEKVLYKVKTTKNAPLWSKQSSKSKRLGTAKKGTVLSVVSTSKNWYKVQYKKGYAYVYIQNASKVKNTNTNTNTSNIPNAPKKTEGFELPTGSLVLDLDVSKVNQVKLTNSWNVNTKNKELENVSKVIGANSKSYSDSGSIYFVNVNPKNSNAWVDDISIHQIFYSSSEMSFAFSNHRKLLEKEGEYLLKAMLKPYFPKSYQLLAEKFVREGYMYAGNNMDSYKSYDGLQVKMVGGELKVRK